MSGPYQRVLVEYEGGDVTVNGTRDVDVLFVDWNEPMDYDKAATLISMVFDIDMEGPETMAFIQRVLDRFNKDTEA